VRFPPRRARDGDDDPGGGAWRLRKRSPIESFPESPVPRDGAILRPTHIAACAGRIRHMYSGPSSRFPCRWSWALEFFFSGVASRDGVRAFFRLETFYGQDLRPVTPWPWGTTPERAGPATTATAFRPQRQNLWPGREHLRDHPGQRRSAPLSAPQAPTAPAAVSCYPPTCCSSCPRTCPLKMAALSDPIACGTRALERAFARDALGRRGGGGLGLGKSVVVQWLGPVGIMTGAAAPGHGGRAPG
jgi:hypothetical protein